MMIIGIDIDNVLNNLCEAVLSVYNEDSGDNLEIKDITEYYIENFVKEPFKENFYRYFVDKRVWNRIKSMKDCRKYISKLHSEGHVILFVTKTEPYNFYKKEKWLQNLFPFLNVKKRFYCCPNKKLLKLDVLIDDYPSNFCDDRNNICFAYPWNASYNGIRCKNWEEIYNTIGEVHNVCNQENRKETIREE